MSTLTTRIAGFKFEIKSDQGKPGRYVGMFFAEKNGERTTFMDLPYDMRSTFDGTQVQFILAAAEDAVSTAFAVVKHAAFSHDYSVAGQCFCDDCKTYDAMFSRQYCADRRVTWA